MTIMVIDTVSTVTTTTTPPTMVAVLTELAGGGDAAVEAPTGAVKSIIITIIKTYH